MRIIKYLLIIASTVLGPITSHSALTLNWSSGVDLVALIPTVQSGWLVQMYQDVGANSTLSSFTSFDEFGAPTGINATDDQLLSSFKTTVTFKTKYQFALNGVDGSAIAGGSVYTVIFNSGLVSGASQAWIMDSVPTIMPASGTAGYSVTTASYGPITVAAVPEPSSVALIGIGLAAIALRRRFAK